MNQENQEFLERKIKSFIRRINKNFILDCKTIIENDYNSLGKETTVYKLVVRTIEK